MSFYYKENNSKTGDNLDKNIEFQNIKRHGSEVMLCKIKQQH